MSRMSTADRRSWILLAGALAGIAVSMLIWYGERGVIARGGTAEGAGFGASHSLFFVSLPWSISVWALMVGTGIIIGSSGGAWLRPFFYAMPIVAGLGWAGLFLMLVMPGERRDHKRHPGR